MPDQNLDYVTIRRNFEKSVYRQKRITRIVCFLANVVLYVVAMLAVWGTALSDPQLHALLFGNGGSAAAAILILPTILWAMAIFFHFISIMTESGVGEKALRERLLMREVGEDILRKGVLEEEPLEKPKRRAAALEPERVVLSDDGELTSADQDERIKPSSYRVRTNQNGAS